MLKTSIHQPIANRWSEPSRGLSGRLRVEFEDLNPGLRHAVYLELRNHALDPIAVTNQPQADAALLDSTGTAVSASSLPASGPAPSPQWAVIPRDAYLGFRVDMQTVGVPTREHGVALLAVGDKAWQLNAGKYVLKVSVVFQKDESGPPNQWVGELQLPPVDVVVTATMVAATGGG
jgi:hypothetical protein